MSYGKINKADSDLLLTAINRIVSTEVLEKVITEQLPLTGNLSDNNQMFCGKV